MIGERIQQARKAAGLSLRALAEKVGVTAMAISKYENNQSTPSSTVLLALADALGVRTEYFFRTTSVNFENVNHREHHKLPEKEEEKVFADIKEQLERWLSLEEVVPTPLSAPYKLPEDLPATISTYGDIENVAILLRQNWKLGLGPIPDLIDSLESRGIKVLITRYDGHKNFDGLSATVNGAPVIVVGQSWPGDRQRFTIAHELGHLVLGNMLSGELNEELACHRFAGAFLVPEAKVFECLGHHRKWLEPRELFLLKHEWGLSMQAWSFRAKELKIITQETNRKIWRDYMGVWKQKSKEPGLQYPQEKTFLFDQLVYRALAEDLMGESKAAELLGMSVSDFHASRSLKFQGEGEDGVVNK